MVESQERIKNQHDEMYCTETQWRVCDAVVRGKLIKELANVCKVSSNITVDMTGQDVAKHLLYHFDMLWLQEHRLDFLQPHNDGIFFSLPFCFVFCFIFV